MGVRALATQAARGAPSASTSVFFLGYANGTLGYSAVRAGVLGRYGAASSATCVQPDAGARIVDHAIVRV